MIKDKDQLVKLLVDFLEQQIVLEKKNGLLIHFDGTLMSLVNLLIARKVQSKPELVALAPITNQNKYASGHLAHLAGKLEVNLEFIDLAKDFEALAFHNYKDQSKEAQIAYSKRFLDLALNIAIDQKRLIGLSNLTYSQWIVSYPNRCFQNPEQINLLYRLFYSELKELAYHLGLKETIVEREPSFFLWNGQNDQELLGFNYQQQESFLRSGFVIKSEQDQLIAKRLLADNRNRFIGPLIQRPSNILG